MIYLDFAGHCFSDTSIEELYDFGVNKLNLKPHWNHYSRHFPHFDLTTKAKKKLAIKLGAIYLKDFQEWKPVVAKTKEAFQTDLPKYLCKGLYGQTIYRVDFKELGFT